MSINANAQQMNFRTKDLIDSLEINKLKHVEDYREAFKGYLEKIEEALKTAVDDFINGKDYTKGFSLSLQAPVSYEKEYNTIIEMLKFCTDETIMLDRRSFMNYVMDEWDWTNSFNNTASLYNKKLG